MASAAASTSSTCRRPPPCWPQAQEFAGALAHRGGTVLFVGTKKQAQDTVRDVAEAAGMPYVNHRWLGGLLTNFQTISQRIRRLHDLERFEAEGQLALLPTRERMAAQADLAKLKANLGGVKNMQRVPDAMFVIDLKTEVIAVKEAQRLRIPIMGLVDTNCDPDGIDFVIPGNDDAIRSCALITQAIGQVVVRGPLRVPRRGGARAPGSRRESPPRGRGARAPRGRGTGRGGEGGRRGRRAGGQGSGGGEGGRRGGGGRSGAERARADRGHANAVRRARDPDARRRGRARRSGPSRSRLPSHLRLPPRRPRPLRLRHRRRRRSHAEHTAPEPVTAQAETEARRCRDRGGSDRDRGAGGRRPGRESGRGRRGGQRVMSTVEVSAKDVKALRERTGAGMMDCKKALTEAQGDVEKAIEILRLKQGKKIQDLGERAATEGTVQAYVHAGAKVGVLIEVDCNTDFVAKNDDFVGFARDVAMQIAATPTVKYVSREDVPADAREAETRIYEQEAADKPENVRERIVAGKLDAWLRNGRSARAGDAQPQVRGQDRPAAARRADRDHRRERRHPPLRPFRGRPVDRSTGRLCRRWPLPSNGSC